MPPDQQQLGQLLSVTDGGSNKATVHYSPTTHQLHDVQLTAACSNTVLDEYDYFFNSLGLVSDVAVFRQVNGTMTTAPVQQVVYSYFAGTYGVGSDTDPTDAYGTLGNMKLAQIEDGANWDPANPGQGNVLDTTDFRYGTSGNDKCLLEYMLSNASYSRLAAAATAAGANPLTMTDVSAYADAGMTYNSAGQVATLALQGLGCSVCEGGLGHYSYSYSTRSGGLSDTNLNHWATQTTETLPDSSTDTIESNSAGETILIDHADPTATQHWYTYFQYDAQGRMIEQADPSAIASVIACDV